MNIVIAKESDLENFFAYLRKQASGNGSDGRPFFQPVSRKELSIDTTVRDKFLIGLTVKKGELGWRKLWLAKNEAGNIVGHIDIRLHTERNSNHRVLLGMGVDIHHRRMGVGEELIKFILKYCEAEETIDWIDLSVLAGNDPAICLYKKVGFSMIGEYQDKFRIDGESISEIVMTMFVKTPA
ncbi:MAG: GNAT family N-acetyltransferase [Pseudomonadota bacterium]